MHLPTSILGITALFGCSVAVARMMFMFAKHAKRQAVRMLVVPWIVGIGVSTVAWHFHDLKVPWLLTRLFFNRSVPQAQPQMEVQDMLQAFKLGIAWRDAGNTEYIGTPREVYVRRGFAEILGSEYKMEQIWNLPTILANQDKDRSLTKKVIAVFNVVNVLWFCSVIGMVGLFPAFIWTILRPIRAHLIVFWDKFLVPLFLRLRFILEPFLYLGSAWLCMESWKLAEFSATSPFLGSMVGVSSLAAFVLSSVYTVVLHSCPPCDSNPFLAGQGVLLSLTAFGLASVHESTLLGTISAVAAALSAWFLEDCSGRGNLDLRLAAICGGASSVQFALQTSGISPDMTRFATSWLSTVGLFGTLSVASMVDKKRIPLLLFAAAGHVALGASCNEPSLTNTAVSYTLAWIYVEFLKGVCRTRAAWYVVGFVSSVSLFGIAWAMNRNPFLAAGLLGRA